MTVNFSAGGDVPAKGVDLIAVLADDSDKSNVLHGENSGRMLDACLRGAIHLASRQGAGRRGADGADPDSFLVSGFAGPSSHPVRANAG